MKVGEEGFAQIDDPTMRGVIIGDLLLVRTCVLWRIEDKVVGEKGGRGGAAREQGETEGIAQFTMYLIEIRSKLRMLMIDVGSSVLPRKLGSAVIDRQRGL